MQDSFYSKVEKNFKMSTAGNSDGSCYNNPLISCRNCTCSALGYLTRRYFYPGHKRLEKPCRASTAPTVQPRKVQWSLRFASISPLVSHSKCNHHTKIPKTDDINRGENGPRRTEIKKKNRGN